MEHWRLTQWCTQAVTKIKYPPDRRAVYDELRQHLDDRCEEFLAQGMTKDEAAKKATEAMGSSYELSVQLAAIHRPFWGFAYSISKWLLRGVAIITAILLLINVVGSLFTPKVETNTIDIMANGTVTGDILLSAKQNWVDSSDGYTFSVKNAYVREDTYTFDDGTEEVRLFLLMECTVTSFSAIKFPYDALYRTWGVDNQGRIYQSGHIWHYFTSDRHLVNGCIFKIRLESYEDLSWFELHYDDAGRDLVLRIELTGGDSV